jgi:hypothetical protein
MAILRNREVIILGRADGGDVSPTYTVQYPDLERENVTLRELQLTSDEYTEMTKQNGESNMGNVRKIEDKDLQALRDGQDAKKIEDAQSKNPAPSDITVRSVKVDAGEVASQLPNTKSNTPKAK